MPIAGSTCQLVNLEIQYVLSLLEEGDARDIGALRLLFCSAINVWV